MKTAVAAPDPDDEPQSITGAVIHTAVSSQNITTGAVVSSTFTHGPVRARSISSGTITATSIRYA